MKIIYSEFDFYRHEKYQLTKKLYLDGEKVFWRVEPNKNSQEYFQTLKELKSFPDSQKIIENEKYVDFNYGINFSEYRCSSNPELFTDFINRNFQTITVDEYDFSNCKYLAGLNIPKNTILVLDSYLSLFPNQISRLKSQFFLKTIYEFPCAAIPLELLELGIFSNGVKKPESKFKNLEKTLAYKISRYNYFEKYAKERKVFAR